MRKKVLITGASGMVGYAMCRAAISNNYEVVGLGREDRHQISGMCFKTIDLRNTYDLRSFIEISQPDIVVHLAATTRQSDCENDPRSAKQLHVHVSGAIAAISRDIRSRFIHVSTEAVYGDLGPGLRKESDLCNPSGVYATSKKRGEEEVMLSNPDALVLRVTPVGCSPRGLKTSLAEWLASRMLKGIAITGYTDVLFTPVSSFALARLVFDSKLNGISGIFNWGNADVMSKYEFSFLLAKSLELDGTIITPGLGSKSGGVYFGGMDSRLLAARTTIEPPNTAELIDDLKCNFQVTRNC